MQLAQSIGKEIGADPEVILETSHGRRSIDTLKILAPDKANWECEFCASLLGRLPFKNHAPATSPKRAHL